LLETSLLLAGSLLKVNPSCLLLPEQDYGYTCSSPSDLYRDFFEHTTTPQPSSPEDSVGSAGVGIAPLPIPKPIFPSDFGLAIQGDVSSATDGAFEVVMPDGMDLDAPPSAAADTFHSRKRWYWEPKMHDALVAVGTSLLSRDGCARLEPRHYEEALLHLKQQFPSEAAALDRRRVREHWNQQANPALCKTEWSSDEVRLLQEHAADNAGKWAQLRQLLFERTGRLRSDNDIKCAYNNYLRNGKELRGVKQSRGPLANRDLPPAKRQRKH